RPTRRLLGDSRKARMDESGRRIVWPTTRITHTLQHAPDIRLATEKKEGPPPGQRDSPQISASSTGPMRGRADSIDSTRTRPPGFPVTKKCRRIDPRHSMSRSCRVELPEEIENH